MLSNPSPEEGDGIDEEDFVASDYEPPAYSVPPDPDGENTSQ